jgi:excisionase family DNA binding protein
MKNEHPNLIGVTELAKTLSIRRERIYVLVRKQEIPFYKIGAQLRFDLAEVLAATRRA